MSDSTSSTGDSPPTRDRAPWGMQVFGLLAWIGLTFMGASIGALLGNDPSWYQAITKPDWAPPGWVYGAVWTVLYITMATAAWLVWRQRGWCLGIGLYLVQLIVNGLWTGLFFGLRRMDLALVDMLVLLVLIGATGWAFRRDSRLAAALLAPYFVWVCFATYLTITLIRLNS